MKLIRDELRGLADEDRARVSANFFKTGKEGYGEGDVFLGIRNGDLRRISKVHWDRVGFSVIGDLLGSKVHDERLVGVFILVERFERNVEEREEIYNFYLENARLVNNWDLVDSSAWKIVGRFLLDKDRSVLVRLAESDSLWERRIGIVSTFAFIREGDVYDALKISGMLLGDDEDLMHKAVGWMLREVGKKDRGMLEEFLRENYDELPRTTLRYAIERFEENLRKKWLLGRL